MLQFLRRQKPVRETDVQELRDNFELSSPVSHGVPKSPHRLAIDSTLGLVALITKQGYLELYTKDGNKRVLLKKLGSACSFFEFVEGEDLLLVVCAANPSTGLPESYHLLDTNGVDPCSTTCRPSYLSNAKCFTLARLPDHDGTCILTGNSNGSIFSAELNKEDDQLEFVELASISRHLKEIPINRFSDFTHIRASERFIFCCFQNSLIVILCSRTRRLLKTIDIPFKFTAISINEALNVALFVSSEVQCCISLNDLTVTSSKVIANSFERTNFYEIITSARTNEPILLYCSGIPGCTIRRISSLTLSIDGELKVFTMASDLLDVRIVYDKEEKATAIALLCEHEIIAIDLMDKELRCIPLNFLQCVDSSQVNCIRLETVENEHFFKRNTDRQYSGRVNLFGSNKDKKKKNEKGPKSLIFTGHQNGDIFVWDLNNGGQRLLQVYKTTNYLRNSLDEYPDDDLEEVEIKDVEEFSCEQTDYKPVNPIENANSSSFDWIMQPAKLWRESKSKKILEIGLYDDRCEDDRLAVESFYYCDQLNLLACGLYGGFVLVLSTSDETNSTSQITAADLKFVNARLSEIDQAPTNDSIRIQNSPLWNQSLFKPKPNILCILPQTPIRALSISETTGMVAVGCSTGIVVFDPSSGKVVYSKNFLNYHGVKTVLESEKPLNRLKTMKQTVRKTFRSRSIRMSRIGNQRQIERQVEFRDTKQPTNNGIRCVSFHESTDERSFLFAGTSNAVIYIFEFESNDSCYLCKEIRLSHTAPVVDLHFIRLDNQSKMFIFTEEQIRCFVVETLRSARYSYKLTAKSGLRIRQANIVSSRNQYNYLNLICNDGSLVGMAATDQRIRTSRQITKSDDAIGIRLSAVGNSGEVAFVGQGGSNLTFFAASNH